MSLSVFLKIDFSVLIFLDFNVGLSQLHCTENKIVVLLGIKTQHIDLNFHPQLSSH